jgi:hypothetical protein
MKNPEIFDGFGKPLVVHRLCGVGCLEAEAANALVVEFYGG